ncbi:hypothetical protein LINPERHAP2_LOCUS10067 [Linum perenne]
MKMIGIGRRLIHRRVSPVKLLPFSGETLSSSSDSETASLLNSKTLLKPFLSLASSSAKWVLHPSHRFLSTSSADGAGEEESDGPLLYEISSDGESDGWEEEEEAEAKEVALCFKVFHGVNELSPLLVRCWISLVLMTLSSSLSRPLLVDTSI